MIEPTDAELHQALAKAEAEANGQPVTVVAISSSNNLGKDSEGSSINNLQNYAIKTGGGALFGAAVVSGAKHTIKWIKAHL